MADIDKPGVFPIRHLLKDPEITEVMLNGPRQLFVERRGVMQSLPPVFADAQQMLALVDNLIANTGRAVNAKAPMVDFRLDDGSRVNIVIAPVALNGPIVTIRKFTRTLKTFDDLIVRGTMTVRMARFLDAAVKARLNVIFSGGTGTGKTTTLGLMCGRMEASDRVVVIEDTAELDLSLPHCVRLECRPPGIDGAGGATLGELLKNSLRMRPTRILVGEIRGEEAFEMLHAMTSGHDGSMAVMHASSPHHAISRLELMLLARGLPLPLWAIQRQIATSVDIVIQHAILKDGVRRITHVSEVAGVSHDQVVLQPLFEHRLEGYGADGRAVGNFVAGGVRPKFYDKLRLAVGASHTDEVLAPGLA
jgi:pilus assembly protein CpaF